MPQPGSIQNVLVTGATGFVGRRVVDELLARGLTPICLVRSRRKLREQHPTVGSDRIIPVVGDLSDHGALREAVARSEGVIHLVGIIIARRLRGQTFDRVHVAGTKNVVDAAQSAGVRRFIHLSALGVRASAKSPYHRSKWLAEESVRTSDLDWTILRPSLIHGPEGEFMRLMKRLLSGLAPPFVPYFGDGSAKIQPIFVDDVAYSIVESLQLADMTDKVIDLGGPRAYSWVEFYQTCRRLIPEARGWKRMLSHPPLLAKVIATVSGPPLSVAELLVPSLGLFRFDRGQVDMALEDNTCDHTVAERIFGRSMRPFEDELSRYAEQIR